MKNGVFWVLIRATRRNIPDDTILEINSGSFRNADYLATDPEVPGSIPGAARFSEQH
jgi:hypothetical protein